MKNLIGIILVGAMVAFGAGCSDDGTSGGTGGTGGGTGGTGGGGGGSVVDLCADAGGSGQVLITEEEITDDTLLTADCNYVLTQETYVVGATLSIDPGVTVRGDNGSALIITTSGQIDARGTEDAPIVMTSSRAEGERLTGDWGGLVLLGNARLSWGNAECDGELGECVANIEGLPETENRGRYGGDDDTHDCGTLTYTRIEFAGFRFGQDNELNGLTVGGCGSETELDYIQVHRGLDDGVELFGGTAAISHVIVSGTGDDGIDWDQGFNGSVTNFIVHHFAGSSDDPRGIEADNFSSNNNVQPRSAPQVQYGTVVATAATTNNEGIVLRRGTWGSLDGLVVSGWNRAGVDIRDGAWDVAGGWPDGLLVTNSCFDNNTPDFPEDVGCMEDPDDPGNPTGDEDCNDYSGSGDFSDLANYFPENTNMPAQNNLEEDPGLGDFSGAVDGSGTPDYSVSNANCEGAFAPSGDDWTTGWTAFPAD